MLLCAMLATLPQELAAAHKQRLFFAFRLSRDHCASAGGRERAAQLEPLLRFPVMEAWAAALHDMTYPLQRWTAWQAQLERLLHDGRKVPVTIANPII